MQPFLPKMNKTEYIYGMFLNQHPEYRLMPREKLVSIMLEQKIITKSQADYLNGKTEIPNIKDFINKDNFKMSDLFDAQFSNIDSKSSVGIIKKTEFHKVFKDLIVKPNGQIDMAQFDINNLKNRFKSDIYDVKILSGKPLMIGVGNKKTRKPVLSITFDEKNPNALFCEYTTTKGNSRYYSVENGKVTRFTIRAGEYTKSTIYDKNGKITRIQTQNGSRGILKFTEYDNGYPYIEESDNGRRNLLVEDLHSDITAKNKAGLPTTRPSINKNVLKRINKGNVYTVLYEYKQNYGTDLLDDIKNEIGLDKKIKEKLLSHIKNAMKNSTTQDEATGKYIAEVLANDIYGCGSGKLEENIYLINKYNVGAVAKYYYELAIQKNIEAEKAFTPQKIPFTDITLHPENLVAPIEGLIESIDMEFGLGEEKIDKLIKYITDCARQSGFITKDETYYTEDIRKDLSSHTKDKEKVEIDLRRLGNREIVENNTNFVEPNGKIDSSFRQGLYGDCWLIAGIIAIIETPKGKETLEKLLEYDKKTGDVTVHLKGVNKKYRISAKEIAAFNQLSRGDGDIRAIEIAIDRYFKEIAYTYPSSFVDIEGNHTSAAFNVLLGNGELIGYKALKNKDFNNKNYAYALGSLSLNSKNLAETENGEHKVKLSERHAYAIIKSDKDYVYLKNPNHSTNFSQKEVEAAQKENNMESENIKPFVIRISKADLEAMDPAIYIAKIPN